MSNSLIRKVYYKGDIIKFSKGKTVTVGEIISIDPYTFTFKSAAGPTETISPSSITKIFEILPDISYFERNGKKYQVREIPQSLAKQTKSAEIELIVQQAEIIQQARFHCNCIVHAPRLTISPEHWEILSRHDDSLDRHEEDALIFHELITPDSTQEQFDINLITEKYLAGS